MRKKNINLDNEQIENDIHVTDEPIQKIGGIFDAAPRGRREYHEPFDEANMIQHDEIESMMASIDEMDMSLKQAERVLNDPYSDDELKACAEEVLSMVDNGVLDENTVKAMIASEQNRSISDRKAS